MKTHGSVRETCLYPGLPFRPGPGLNDRNLHSFFGVSGEDRS